MLFTELFCPNASDVFNKAFMLSMLLFDQFFFLLFLFSIENNKCYCVVVFV